MPTLIAAIHGILTSQTDPSWPDKLDAWMLRRDARVKVLKKEYAAGPLPLWNCLVKDPLLARELANEIELFLRPDSEPGRDAFHRVPERGTASGGFEGEKWDAVERIPTSRGVEVWFVAHSNGAVIALMAARRLIARGRKVGGLILTGAACEADVERNGVLEWWRDGALGKAIAYCSAQDEVLDGDPAHSTLKSQPSTLDRLRAWFWGKLIWPYGCLGRTGWLRDGKALESLGNDGEVEAAVPPHPGPLPKGEGEIPAVAGALFTRWFPGGHSAYFAPGNIERTFERIYKDIEGLEATSG